MCVGIAFSCFSLEKYSAYCLWQVFRSSLHPPDYQSRLDIVRANSKTSLDRTGSFLSTSGTLQVRYRQCIDALLQKLEFPQKIPVWLSFCYGIAFCLWRLHKFHRYDEPSSLPHTSRGWCLITLSLISCAHVYAQHHPSHHFCFHTCLCMPVTSCISSYVQFPPAS